MKRKREEEEDTNWNLKKRKAEPSEIEKPDLDPTEITTTPEQRARWLKNTYSRGNQQVYPCIDKKDPRFLPKKCSYRAKKKLLPTKYGEKLYTSMQQLKAHSKKELDIALKEAGYSWEENSKREKHLYNIASRLNHYYKNGIASLDINKKDSRFLPEKCLRRPHSTTPSPYGIREFAKITKLKAEKKNSKVKRKKSSATNNKSALFFPKNIPSPPPSQASRNQINIYKFERPPNSFWKN